MKINTILRRCTVLLVSLLLSACTTQAWYEGVKQGAAEQCRQTSPADPEACLSRLNTKSYDEYNKERSGQ